MLTDVKYDALKRMLYCGSTEHLIEDLEIAEWLRDKTEKGSMLDVLFFSEVANYLERVPTLEEFQAAQCVYHPEEIDMMTYILRDRMGCGDAVEHLVHIIDPQKLYEYAEAKMGIKVLESKVAINCM